MHVVIVSRVCWQKMICRFRISDILTQLHLYCTVTVLHTVVCNAICTAICTARIYSVLIYYKKYEIYLRTFARWWCSRIWDTADRDSADGEERNIEQCWRAPRDSWKLSNRRTFSYNCMSNSLSGSFLWQQLERILRARQLSEGLTNIVRLCWLLELLSTQSNERSSSSS